MDYEKRGSWPWEQRAMISSDPGVYAIMRGDEALLIAQAETGVSNRLKAFEKSATTGMKANTGGQTFYRMGQSFENLRIEVFDTITGHPADLTALKDALLTAYVQETGKRPVCNTRIPSAAKAYLAPE